MLLLPPCTHSPVWGSHPPWCRNWFSRQFPLWSIRGPGWWVCWTWQKDSFSKDRCLTPRWASTAYQSQIKTTFQSAMQFGWVVIQKLINVYSFLLPSLFLLFHPHLTPFFTCRGNTCTWPVKADYSLSCETYWYRIPGAVNVQKPPCWLVQYGDVTAVRSYRDCKSTSMLCEM